ncbi:Trk system potassium transporter TrkA [Salinispira pacifica]|uniref:Trk system potassium transporter TrkA n=1 Tax=Salinispira pacifica TaxID=1307761 RepID=UPI0006A6E9FD|nr:Trk system potassium transporter TrkA [Salinispira pacifica]
MNIIIVGAGVVGFQVARRLIDEGKNVTIIEQHEESARYAGARLDCMVLTGQGNDLEILRKAGAEKADYFIALTGSDEINMICCSLVAAEFRIPNKVARVRNVEYMQTQMAEQRYLGIDYMINPETEAAKNIIQQLDTGARNYVMVFENLDIQIQRFVVSGRSPFANMVIHKLPSLLPLPFIVPVIQREEQTIIPDGSTTILEGDEMYIAAKEADFKKIHQFLGEKQESLKRVLVVGGGSIGRMVLHHLMGNELQEQTFFRRFTRMVRRKNARSVRVVERDYQKCKQISDRYPDALVINADISEEDIFEEEQLNECDLLITATENPELNIVAGLYARKIGIDRAITLVRSENYAHIASELGINVIVSLKDTVVNSILKYLLKGNVTSIQTAARGKIDFLELQVEPESQIVGRTLREIRFPPETLLLYINREKKTFIPDGDARVEANDHILILARKEFVPRIEDLVTASSDG